MYTPFMLACNCALDKLSEIRVEGSPPFELKKQIVFLCNSDRSVLSENHLQGSRVEPDIVLLQWNLFLKRLFTSSPDASVAKLSYSDSYLRDIRVSKSDLELSGRTYDQR